jgi:pilus assembly protein CpaF
MTYEELYEGILGELDLSREIDDMQLIEVIHEMLEVKSRDSYLSLKEKSRLGKELFNAFRRLDILQELLEDEEITEIMINGTDYIFIEKGGQMFQTEKRFASRRKLEDVIQNIVAGANRVVNEATPIVDARLQDGSRVNVVLYPIALNGPVVTIRKFPKDVMTMEELIRRDSVNLEIVELLEKLMISKYNLFVSGGTGSG